MENVVIESEFGDIIVKTNKVSESAYIGQSGSFHIIELEHLPALIAALQKILNEQK